MTRWRGRAIGVKKKQKSKRWLRRAGRNLPPSTTRRRAWETIAPLLDRSSPLRTSHLRDPVGPQIHFASESFMDEVAAALNQDPIEFRLRHIKDARDIALIKAAAQKFGWDTRPSPRKDQTGNKVSGRGIAYRPAQRHAGRGDRRGRDRPLDRQDLGAKGSRWRMTAARSSTRMAWRSASRATSCRASAARCGKRSSSTTRA